MYHSTHVESELSLQESGLSIHSGTQGLDSGHQLAQQAQLLSESSVGLCPGFHVGDGV